MAAGGSGGSNGEAAEFEASQPMSTFSCMACVLVLDGSMASELAARESRLHKSPAALGPQAGASGLATVVSNRSMAAQTPQGPQSLTQPGIAMPRRQV